MSTNRVTVRLPEETNKKLLELMSLYQKQSISNVTASDVIRKAIDYLYIKGGE